MLVLFFFLLNKDWACEQNKILTGFKPNDQTQLQVSPCLEVPTCIRTQTCDGWLNELASRRKLGAICKNVILVQPCVSAFLLKETTLRVQLALT